MARTINRLSHRKVETLKKPGMHNDGGGLYLQITEGSGGTPRKSWLFRYAVGGRERQMGLGPLTDVYHLHKLAIEPWLLASCVAPEKTQFPSARPRGPKPAWRQRKLSRLTIVQQLTLRLIERAGATSNMPVNGRTRLPRIAHLFLESSQFNVSTLGW
jgi:hypothetical protein